MGSHSGMNTLDGLGGLHLVAVLAAICLLLVPTGATAQDEAPHLLTLEQAMRLALERNPAVGVALTGAEAARYSLEGQQARRLPTLSFDASARISESLSRTAVVGGDTIRTGGGRSESSDVQLTLSHTFYQSGRDEAISEARQRTRASELGIDDTVRRLLADVAATFHGVLAQQELAEVADRAVSAAQLHLDLVDARIEAGTVAPADRLAVEAALADAEFEAVRTVNAVWTRLADLQALLALPTDELPVIRGELDAPSVTGDLEEWVAEALEMRPDLQAQRHRLRATELSLRQAEIDAGLTMSVQGQADYGRHTGNTGETWFIGGGLSFPLFNKQARASVDRAEADLESVRQTLAEQELSVSRQVAGAWYTLRDAIGRVEAAGVSVAASATNLEAARGRYAEGVVTIIEVTDAELSWRRAQANLVQARFDRNVAWYQLLAAAGRPLVDEAVEDDSDAPAATDELNAETVGD
ncbi:MAG: TolC family protein [Armatimonadota bacterium]|jgi:outer membrane protein